MPPGTPRPNGIPGVAGAIVGEYEPDRSCLLGMAALQLERAAPRDASAMTPASERAGQGGRAELAAERVGARDRADVDDLLVRVRPPEGDVPGRGTKGI